MRYQTDQGVVSFDAGLGYTGPQYVSRCVAPAVMPIIGVPPCAQCQPWPPFSPCAPWPPPGTPYWGRPDSPPPLPGTVLYP